MLSRGPVLISGLGVLLIVLAATRSTPWLVWNTTASAPEGVYSLQPSRRLRRGDWVAVRPPPALGRWLDQRGYAPLGVVLVKQVAALGPSAICRRDGIITVDQTLVAQAEPVDRRGRPLPRWRGCRRLRPDEVFVLNAAPTSLDGRYFGPLPRSSVVGVLSPLWVMRDPPHAR